MSLKTKIARICQNQRKVTKNVLPTNQVEEKIKAERNMEKDRFDPQFMSAIRMITDAAQKGIQVIFVTSSTGNFNCDVRRLTGLQSKIPRQMMDPDMEFFHPFQEHFNLLGLDLEHPRYMDFLRPGTPYLFCTFKTNNGDSGTILRKEKTPPKEMAPTTVQQNLYIQKSQDVDITTNSLDIICYRHDEQTPFTNYTMVIEGNPKLASAISALRNLIPSPEDRPAFDDDGNRIWNDQLQQYQCNQSGAPVTHWPNREDNTLLIEQVLCLIFIKKRLK